jgi:uncharacterized membrane protein YdbT with pleckstrin-like domain
VPFSRKLLNEHEGLVLDLHPHWVYFLKSGLVFLVTVAVGILLLAWDGAPDFLGIPSGVVILLALGWFGWTYLEWVTTNFVITTDRLIYRHGVLSKHGIEIPLERVNTVFFSQSILERMVGSGDLVIESAGELGRQNFSNVRKPSAVQNEIHKQMEANENRKFDRVKSGPSAAPAESIPDQIAKLDQLRQQGALTQEEFDTKKQQLLDRM